LNGGRLQQILKKMRYELRIRKLDPTIGENGTLVENTQPVIDIERDKYIDADTYETPITIGLIDTVTQNEFSNQITVTHKNGQNGYEVDIQRTAEINEHIKNLNK